MAQFHQDARAIAVEEKQDHQHQDQFDDIPPYATRQGGRIDSMRDDPGLDGIDHALRIGQQQRALFEQPIAKPGQTRQRLRHGRRMRDEYL